MNIEKRALKFRTYGLVNGKWELAVLSELDNNGHMSVSYLRSRWEYNESITVQFTGLYDCEGKEVFHGDILEYISERELFRVEMCWEDYSWILKSKPLKCGKIIRENVSQFEVGGKLVRCKAIGNLLENGAILEN